ncbi:site-specific DNA-methyltransferase [Frankia sp. AgPm24]|uniref:DNA-methyltransferase n=1 Tax=Frankia sp. AgPm24 TaxID=631128 RepID=UPI0020103AA7|nr:site-specific DNA-methyltransferase [Frankia sp. AgPm24]MCK9922465.1 site-specific DNA-methyltransferase [Frankia sp. AgPm24]
MPSPTPYYDDGEVTLYHGDSLQLLADHPDLLAAEAIVTDPPYGETSLAWDVWPGGWPALAARAAQSMWCFGSMRMFLQHHSDFAGWRLSQDIVWQKRGGSGPVADRFRRVHEYALHWYRGRWREIYKDPQREPNPVSGMKVGTVSHRRAGAVPHFSGIGPSTYLYDGTRLVHSVIPAKSMRGRALHPTEKPPQILAPLIRYSCPPGRAVLDPFAGSGSTLAVARSLGRRAIGIERDERYAEVAARRLSRPHPEV